MALCCLGEEGWETQAEDIAWYGQLEGKCTSDVVTSCPRLAGGEGMVHPGGEVSLGLHRSIET